MIRVEWWKNDVLVTEEALRDFMERGILLDVLLDQSEDLLRAQGGVGRPWLEILRVRPSSLAGSVKFVLQGQSQRRV